MWYALKCIRYTLQKKTAWCMIIYILYNMVEELLYNLYNILYIYYIHLMWYVLKCIRYTLQKKIAWAQECKSKSPLPGIEPGSPAWQAGILTTILQRPILQKVENLTHTNLCDLGFGLSRVNGRRANNCTSQGITWKCTPRV